MDFFSEGSLTQLEDLEGRRRQDYVKDSVCELGINFDWEKYPELLDRLEKMAEGSESHLADSIEIAKIFELLWDDLGLEGVDRQEMQLAAIFHDIGKTGPLGASPAQQKVIARLFEGKNIQVTSEMSLREYVEATQGGEIFDTIEVLEELGLTLDIDPDEDESNVNREGTVIAFFRHHVDWTFDILNKEELEKGDDKIGRRMVLITASHHLLEHKNPAHLDEHIEGSSNNLNLNIVLKAARTLSMFDQYHALRERGGKSHHAAVAILEKKVKDYNGDNLEASQDFISTLRVIKNNAELLESVIIQLDSHEISQLKSNKVDE